MPSRFAFHREVKEEASSPPSYAQQMAGTVFDVPASKPGALPTSQKAARRATLSAKSIAARMLAVYASERRPLTPDQVAGILGRDILSVRPRASQALRRGYLVETTKEVPTDHGGESTALEITELGKKVVRNLGLLGPGWAP